MDNAGIGFLPAPPEPRDDSTDSVSDHIVPIARRRHHARSRPLADQRPDTDMEQDLTRFRETIVRAPAELALHPQHQRKRARDQQQVIEMIVEKSPVQVRLEPPAMERVEGSTGQEVRIAPVTETIHRSAVRMNPKPAARAIFRMTSMKPR